MRGKEKKKRLGLLEKRNVCLLSLATIFLGLSLSFISSLYLSFSFVRHQRCWMNENVFDKKTANSNSSFNWFVSVFFSFRLLRFALDVTFSFSILNTKNDSYSTQILALSLSLLLLPSPRFYFLFIYFYRQLLVIIILDINRIEETTMIKSLSFCWTIFCMTILIEKSKSMNTLAFIEHIQILKYFFLVSTSETNLTKYFSSAVKTAQDQKIIDELNDRLPKFLDLNRT